MRFRITLHLRPVTEESELGNLEVDIKEALEHIPCVDRAEVESEGRKGIGDQ